MALRARPDDDPLSDGAAGAAATADGNGRPAAARRRSANGVASLPHRAAELERANARLERANRELWAENARLARARLGRADAAAAAELVRFERDLHTRTHAAEARLEVVERLLATPRHQVVERIRDRAMRSPFFYKVVRRLWAQAAKR